jgi:glycosyltransferase involved in cell wall biosynthesis
VLSRTLAQKETRRLGAHLLFVGGEDHNLRIPFILALRAKGYDVSAAASGDPEPFARAGIEHRRFEFNRFMDPQSDWRTLHVLRSLLEDVGADIAHCFDTKLGLLVPFAARTNRRTRIVRTINGRGWLYSSRSLGALALRASYRPLQCLAASSTAATIFEHHGDQRFFERNHLLGKGEAAVIPGAGIDIDGFERARARGVAPERLRQELGLNGAEVVITVTRVTRQKGIITLLKAAALVHEARPSVKFLIVGPRESEGPFGVTEAEIQEHAGYVIATGPRPDVASLLAMADLFAFPSEYAEGLPRALMEAALCGLPIVATDLAGCREIIRDGWNGYLVPERRPRALANRILHALENREESARMAERGPDLVRREFSLEKVVERHAELYERQLLPPRPQCGARGNQLHDEEKILG